MQCCLEKGPNVVVLLGMGEREREREREREDVNGSFHRQEKLLWLGNKYLEKLNLIFVYVKTPGVTVELNCFRPTNRFDFAY